MGRAALRTMVAALASGLAGLLLAVAAAGADQTREDLARMLPATDLGGDPAAASALAVGAAPGFAFARIPPNPDAPRATPVGERVCTACHALEDEHFSHTMHALGLRAAAHADPAVPVCEACHGAGSEHAADPSRAGAIIAYTREAGSDVVVQTQTCLNCHAGGPRDQWAGSVHQRNGLSCSDCHNPMGQFSPEGLQARASINETCSTCHRDVRQQFERRSHMPLPEGHITCADCHNPHGTLTAPLLKTASLNETCYQCHAEKRGPFLFEHAPVRQNCLNCHMPHGSNQASLLVAPTPFLCQQCHSHLRHPNDLQTRASLGDGPNPDERAIARNCITCHAQIHGSNNPSGPRFHR